MDITTLAAWGEFIGGIAVVVSLLYLAVQIRINTKIVRASNFRNVIGDTSGFTTMIVDPATAALYVRGAEDFAGLSAEDQARFHGLMCHLTNPVNQAFALHHYGLLDRDIFENQIRTLAILFERPGAKQWWKANEHWWPPDFREFVRESLPE